ncbi:uncharacterized protein LOC135096770 isoform X3 [Scylla paramamosain]|uniref:uncharacterized protein LOC135096770 isoform X3 n=1 Tax=Scylla paramamosain TaxID=85552 RepID=UPI003082B3A9
MAEGHENRLECWRECAVRLLSRRLCSLTTHLAAVTTFPGLLSVPCHKQPRKNQNTTVTQGAAVSAERRWTADEYFGSRAFFRIMSDPPILVVREDTVC